MFISFCALSLGSRKSGQRDAGDAAKVKLMQSGQKEKREKREEDKSKDCNTEALLLLHAACR